MKRKKIYYLLFLVVNFIPIVSFSKEYFCPKIPNSFYIGQSLEDGWYIDTENQDYPIYKKLYLKIFKIKQQVNFWGGFPQGKISSLSGDNKMFIGCCSLKSMSNIQICAFREVNEVSCKTNLWEKGPEKYTCE